MAPYGTILMISGEILKTVPLRTNFQILVKISKMVLLGTILVSFAKIEKITKIKGIFDFFVEILKTVPNGTNFEILVKISNSVLFGTFFKILMKILKSVPRRTNFEILTWILKMVPLGTSFLIFTKISKLVLFGTSEIKKWSFLGPILHEHVKN